MDSVDAKRRTNTQRVQAMFNELTSLSRPTASLFKVKDIFPRENNSCLPVLLITCILIDQVAIKMTLDGGQ
jgi:hypothetical protein